MLIHFTLLLSADALRISETDSKNQQLLKEEIDMAAYFSNYTKCLMVTPQLWRSSYSAASFCRVYAYSCNNLWAESFHSEVNEGIFCFIDAFEKSQTIEEYEATRKMYQTLLGTIVAPYYDMLMTNYGLMSQAQIKAARRRRKSSFVSLSTLVPHCSADMEAVQIRPQLKCMIQNMKAVASGIGTKYLPPSDLTQNQTLSLLEKMQKVTERWDLVKKAEDLVDFQLKGSSDDRPLLESKRSLLEKRSQNMSTIMEKMMFPGGVGTKGPLKSSLGGVKYMFSAAQGFVGPVSPKYRYAYDHPNEFTKSGLYMEAHDLIEDDPLAVCNDGTTALMYMGPNTSKTKWHFHIDGGFFCYDKMSCYQRAKMSTTLISTKGWERSKWTTGMFDPKFGGFPEYTHAQVGYCSSDAFFGQIETDEFTMVGGTQIKNSTGTYFRGYTILQAVLKKFLKMGLAATPGQELWVSGCSAGAIAAAAQADSWKSRIEDLAKEMKLKVYPLKIWTSIDGAPIANPDAPYGEYGQQTIFEMAGNLVTMLYGPQTGASPNAFLNKDCAKAHKNNPSNCVLPPVVLPHIQIKNIYIDQLWDNFITGQMLMYFAPSTPQQYEQGLEVVKAQREVFKTVTKQQNYHATSCGDHCTSTNANFWRMRPNTAKGDDKYISIKQAILDTRDGKTGKVVADECDNYNCGCIGQGPAYTKLGQVALFFQALYYLNPAAGNMWTSTMSLATASDQLYNAGQLISP